MREYKRIAVLCFIGAFMGPFGGNVVNILIPRMQKEFNTSFYNVSMSISIYMIAFASFQLLSGLISDVVGRRNTILFGFITFFIGSIICFFALSMKLFLLGRFVQGIGNAFMTPILMALLADFVPKGSMGKYMGMFGSVQTGGIFLAPVVGGVFAGYGWRYVFLFLSILSLILILIYYSSFKYSSKVKKGELIDKKTLKGLLLKRDIIFLSISSFIGYFGFGSLGFLFAKYIYLRMGVSESVNGLIISMTGFASVIFSPYAGRLNDKYNRAAVSISGIALIAPIIFMVPYIESPITLSIALFAMGGFSSAVWSAVNTLAVDTVPEIRGTVSSIVNSLKYFSFSLSPVAYGKLYDDYGIETPFAIASLITILQAVVMTIYGYKSFHRKAFLSRK